MTKELAKIQSALGLDISRDGITLFESRSGRTLTIANNAEALRTALASLDLQVPMLAVCETTGGNEDKALSVLFQLAIPVHRADAAKVKPISAPSAKGPSPMQSMPAGWFNTALTGTPRSPAGSLPLPPKPRSSFSSPAAPTWSPCGFRRRTASRRHVPQRSPRTLKAIPPNSIDASPLWRGKLPS
ncbi:hypothetical protein J2Z31_000188 [Sinorhizobium kostiense]|uniref:Transposase n=1 Tax=Sinorhizobium kostiense TaxID=76747 RepID=A0ABS4QSR2_9HYPH|nr:hypothetical protein [Sinorhizobium kostiense]